MFKNIAVLLPIVALLGDSLVSILSNITYTGTSETISSDLFNNYINSVLQLNQSFLDAIQALDIALEPANGVRSNSVSGQ